MIWDPVLETFYYKILVFSKFNFSKLRNRFPSAPPWRPPAQLSSPYFFKLLFQSLILEEFWLNPLFAMKNLFQRGFPNLRKCEEWVVKGTCWLIVLIFMLSVMACANYEQIQTQFIDCWKCLQKCFNPFTVYLLDNYILKYFNLVNLNFSRP